MISFGRLEVGDIVRGRKGDERRIVQKSGGFVKYVSRKSPDSPWRTRVGHCCGATISEWGDSVTPAADPARA